MSSILNFEIDTALAIFQLGHAPLLLDKLPNKKEMAELCLKNLQHLASQSEKTIRSISATSWTDINDAIRLLTSNVKIEEEEGSLPYAIRVSDAADLLRTKRASQ